MILHKRSICTPVHITKLLEYTDCDPIKKYPDVLRRCDVTKFNAKPESGYKYVYLLEYKDGTVEITASTIEGSNE